MIASLLALALAAQVVPNQPIPLRPDSVPPRETTPGNELHYEDLRLPSPQARAAMQDFAACAARNSPELAASTLRTDFTTTAYRDALRRVARVNEGCFRRRGGMRASGLPFAGALAEAMIERDQAPLNVRLARAAQQPAIPAFSASDRLAICVVRTLPDETGALMASDVGSAAEETAVAALMPAIRACGQADTRLQSNAAGLRAVLATAAYRSVAPLAAPTRTN